MSTIVCYKPEFGESEEGAWLRITDPDFLSQRQDTLVLELPNRGSYRAFVNGLDVLGGIQVVERGDLVRVTAPDGEQIAYVVGRALSSTEPGGGRACQFSGKTIDGQATICSSCGAVFAQEVVEQLGDCPACREPLGDHDELPPEEELL